MSRVVLITGASRGIGRAMAIKFAESGWLVAANYNKSEDRALQLKRMSDNIYICKADVSNRNEVNNMIENIRRELGPICVLINNAAVSSIKMFSDITEEEWDYTFDVNIKGVYNCTQEVLPDMIRKKSGSIINISSMWGQVGASCEVHYSAAKAAIIGFTKALAKELGPSFVRVNCIAPGVVSTEMNMDVDLSALREETPLGRLGTASEVAECAYFLASDNSSFITGQVIGVNGGLVV
ncbi:MAG TPA: 3-oxoacyl-ACP reductase FabG [Clostridia bacterium]|jgi:3-oxoacyl-[acyl-carrier protein] reductase|nr:3-oxoacyl-ACP reductase FabG [Clostridiaceae bacterium]HOA32676.1 3-oxoacyl-ACP reductase FabG [Clostridia bacterium]HPZ53358.1 3-oxoacyl-ACP reductase FabG [Clostridia bacterium]